MGYAHLLWIYEDGIRNAGQLPAEALKYREAIGAAVLKLCLDPAMMQTPEGIRPVTSEPISNCSNCVNLAATLHSTGEKIFVWAGNCVRIIDQLDDIELENAKRQVDALYNERKKQGNQP